MAVIVVGMHRSGTSAVASAIEALGVTTGDAAGLMGADEHNRGGYFEQVGVVELNNEILAYLGGTALEPIELPSDWRDDDFLSSSVDRVRQLLASLFADQCFVLKDPRISVLLPLWREALGDQVVFVFVVRDPWEVAMSLQRRDASELETGVASWVQYNQSLARDMAGARVHALVYQELLDDPTKALGEMSASLINWDQLPAGSTIDDAVARIDASQRRNEALQVTPIDPVLAREVLDLFEQYESWRGRHEHFETEIAPTPWWSKALLAERRTLFKVQHSLQREIDQLREGYEILDIERYRLGAREFELSQNLRRRPLLALSRLLRRRGTSDA